MCWGFSSSSESGTRLRLAGSRGAGRGRRESGSDGPDGDERGAQLLPAARLDDSLATNHQKLGEMIENVTLKFSLVRTKIVLSPDRGWTKLRSLSSFCPRENLLHPDVSVPSVLERFTDKRPLSADAHYCSAPLIQGSRPGQQATFGSPADQRQCLPLTVLS